MKSILQTLRGIQMNTAGRTVMVKNVTSSLAVYQMNCFKIPKKICKTLSNLQRDFWWGKDENEKNKKGKKGVYPKGWKPVCKPLEEGGLGIQNIENFNMAVIAKIGWKLKENPERKS